MRIFIALAACLVLATSIATARGRAHETERQATLRLLDNDPVKLRGTQFLAGERIRITSTVGGKRKARTVRANGVGGFAVTFADQSVDKCMGFRATAVGNDGSGASLKLPELFCPPRL